MNRDIVRYLGELLCQIAKRKNFHFLPYLYYYIDMLKEQGYRISIIKKGNHYHIVYSGNERGVITEDCDRYYIDALKREVKIEIPNNDELISVLERGMNEVAEMLYNSLVENELSAVEEYIRAEEIMLKHFKELPFVEGLTLEFKIRNSNDAVRFVSIFGQKEVAKYFTFTIVFNHNETITILATLNLTRILQQLKNKMTEVFKYLQ